MSGLTRRDLIKATGSSAALLALTGIEGFAGRLFGEDSDTDSRMVLADYGFRARNRYTLGIFADVNAGTPMVAGP